MTADLPIDEDLAQLSLRAIAAYGCRAAQRVVACYPVPYAETCGRALRAIQDFVRSSSPTRSIVANALFAARDVAEAEALDDIGRNPVVGLSVRAAVMCCHYASVAADSTRREEAATYRNRAAGKAAMAARWMKPDDIERAVVDFVILAEVFGRHDTAELGPPFDPSESGRLGPL